MVNRSTKRATIQTTVGTGPRFPSSSVNLVSRSINSQTPGRIVIPYQVVATDFFDLALSYTGVASGTENTLTGTAVFSNLPTVQTGPNDVLKFHCIMTVDNPIAHLVLQSFHIAPQSQNLNGSGVVAQGPVYTGRTSINIYQGAVTLIVRAAANTSSGTITCHCQASLALQPG